MATNGHPTVSVVMPVRDAARYLRAAVDSILAQTYTDLELIAVDDGSTDGSLDLLRAYVDPRLIVLTQANAGYPTAMRTGMAVARGRYIARMDADDISVKTRIAEEAAFLDANPSYGLVGTRYGHITPRGAQGRTAGEIPDEPWSRVTHDQVFQGQRGFADPSVMFRTDVAAKVGGYRTYQRSGQDVDLWMRILESGTQAAVVNQVLYLLRLTPASITSSSGTAALANVPRILAEQRKRDGADIVMRGGSAEGLVTDGMRAKARYWFVWDPWRKAEVCFEAGDLVSAGGFVMHGIRRGKLSKDTAGHAIRLIRFIWARRKQR